MHPFLFRHLAPFFFCYFSKNRRPTFSRGASFPSLSPSGCSFSWPTFSLSLAGAARRGRYLPTYLLVEVFHAGVFVTHVILYSISLLFLFFIHVFLLILSGGFSLSPSLFFHPIFLFFNVGVVFLFLSFFSRPSSRRTTFFHSAQFLAAYFGSFPRKCSGRERKKGRLGFSDLLCWFYFFWDLGWLMIWFFRRSFRKSVASKPDVRKQLDDIEDHRPYFTYWITTVQILILIISIACYGFGPVGFDLAHRSSLVCILLKF